MESQLLRLLLNKPSHFFSRVQLLLQLRLSDQDLNALIRRLSSWGFLLESHPTLGIRLLQPPSTLHLDEVYARLPVECDWPLFHLNETVSTMDFILREGHRGAPHGTLVVANTQTEGRGRHGRSWSSAPELGLYLSLLLRPDFPIESFSRITIIAAVATLQTAEKLSSLDLQIKWPNDLMIGKRKLAGILTEAHFDRSQQPFAVLGLGINLLHTQSDFPVELQSAASSLLIESNRSIRRTDFLVEWIKTFQKSLALPFAEIIEIWKYKCLNLGENIVVSTPSGKIYGMAIDLEPNGALLLRDDYGKIHSILSGVVEL